MFSALNNNDVWCDGLLVFYEIFKFLEENVSTEILPMEYYRTEQFEKDIDFYKKCDWRKNYSIRDSVKCYLNHLNEIKEQNPFLLIPYVYHLYMGLLSGGQILSKKRNLQYKLQQKFREQRDDEHNDNVEPGFYLTSFPSKSVSELKTNLRSVIDKFCEGFDEKTRQEMIEESKKVFEFNNLIINSVEGVGDELKKKLRKFLGFLLLIILSIYLFNRM